MCKMSGRAVAACVALLAVCLSTVFAQDGIIYVKVSDRNLVEREDIEKRLTPELVRDLNAAQSDALLLYTEYTAKAGSDLKIFLKMIAEFVDEALRRMDQRSTEGDPGNCRKTFQDVLKKIQLDAYKSASFSGENHHKFLLGHMVVFRMHLNKTEEYIRKCERALYGCGANCERQPKVRRWKRLALNEIHRVKDDLQHTRRSYKDLVAHAKRRLNHLQKELTIKTKETVENYHKCLDVNYNSNY